MCLTCFSSSKLSQLIHNLSFNSKNTIYHLEQEMFNKYKTDWCTRMDSYGQGSKLRTYKLFNF
jgi:hypothetical protein